MYDNYYLKEILEEIANFELLVLDFHNTVHQILISLIFFGLLFFAFNFISKRWLTL